MELTEGMACLIFGALVTIAPLLIDIVRWCL